MLNGHSAISPEMAIRLDKAFGGGAETWYRLQAAYDLSRPRVSIMSIQPPWGNWPVICRGIDNGIRGSRITDQWGQTLSDQLS